MRVVNSTFAAKKFGAVSQLAQRETVMVKSNGRESVYILSPATFHALTANTVKVHVAGSIPKNVLGLIRAAKPSPESERFNDEIR